VGWAWTLLDPKTVRTKRHRFVFYMATIIGHFSFSSYPFQIIYIEINRYFNVLLLSLFPHIFMHTYNRRHNIDNQIRACAYAFK
jgi:hypothetical protein